MLLEVTLEPNPILHKKGRDLTVAELSTPTIKKLILDMTETMYVKDGVGIAAPQVGESLQLCVIAKKFSPLNKNEDLILVNPVWKKTSILKAWDIEGCLSVPLVYGEVKRYTNIVVQALNQFGEKIEFKAKDFPARIVQHEVDHLNGTLFIEKARKLQKLKASEQEL
ncbi:MAG: Peptide deformylase [uncultured bacterium]|uniref:Peptide deformylase n=1 Tax=Candidatus Magasanikbacteria bacterium RIFOXYD2_FULL_36_9 TaxID=1798707 RepID=A0A1F6P2M2_9BACT|nr:MAG: Peptide deformylase [uncultured bacterium]OGH90194.1 MAG: peptide deformylase [Candidatus Magasanikbacteria bacterium RIFOXYD2_FULL_36_9]